MSAIFEYLVVFNSRTLTLVLTVRFVLRPVCCCSSSFSSAMDIDDLILAFIEDDSDEENDELDEQQEDPDTYRINVEMWRRMGDPQFQKHFRMDRHLFETLTLLVGRHMTDTGRIIRRGTPIDLSLMMTLWILATPDTFRSVAIKFGVKEGSVHNQYKTMILVLCELRERYIQWPATALEKAMISENFENMYGYPSVCGCIDGCLIRITAPLEQPQRYVNHHHDYFILLQGVCDHRLVFRDVFVGQPGSVGDARTFRRSQLRNLLLRKPDFVGDFHLVGDGAYTLTDTMMIPYRDYGNLTERQRTHNYILSRCRSSIERAFALLKGKWRRLKYFPSYCLEYAIEHIMSCIVLHNFIILQGEEYEEANDDDDDDDAFMVPEDIPTEQLLIAAQHRGTVKREYIATMLHPF